MCVVWWDITGRVGLVEQIAQVSGGGIHVCHRIVQVLIAGDGSSVFRLA